MQVLSLSKRHSCTRQQHEVNKRTPEFKPNNYYLFGGTDSMTAKDVTWAKNEDIIIVGVVNLFRYREPTNAAESIATDIRT